MSSQFLIFRRLFLLLLLSTFDAITDACSCEKAGFAVRYHDISHTLVVRAKVRRIRHSKNKPKEMLVRVSKVYKGCDVSMGDDLFILTDYSGASCGVSLNSKQEYLLFVKLVGRDVNGLPKLWIELCSFHSLWSMLTEEEVEYLETRQICCDENGTTYCHCVHEQLPCPNPQNYCFMDPCSVTSCKDGSGGGQTTCISNLCGNECRAEFFFGFENVPVCFECRTDEDCDRNQVCHKSGECRFRPLEMHLFSSGRRHRH